METTPSETPGKDTTTKPSVDEYSVSLDTVTPRPYQWLWHQRLALGKIHYVDGMPDLGKSTLVTDWIARITAGQDWPLNTGTPIQGGAVIVTTEDDVADTIVRRLMAAGADLSRVRHMGIMRPKDKRPAAVDLIQHLNLIEQACVAVEARIVVVDPIMAHLGTRTDTYKDSEVRAILAPVSDMLARIGAAGIMIRHLTKSGGDKAILRGQGSIGFIGAARLAMMVGEHPVLEDRRVLAMQKSNIARKAPSIIYRLVSSESDPEVAHVLYEGFCKLTADDLVAPQKPGRKAEKLQHAIALLLERLIKGPASQNEIAATAEKRGVSERTLREAKKLLGIKSRKDAMDGGWTWSLPQVPLSLSLLQPSQNGSKTKIMTEIKPSLPKAVGERKATDDNLADKVAEPLDETNNLQNQPVLRRLQEVQTEGSPGSGLWLAMTPDGLGHLDEGLSTEEEAHVRFDDGVRVFPRNLIEPPF